MTVSTPSYLYLRGRLWWFRFRLPKPYQSCILRMSLKTSDRRLARLFALYLASYLRRAVSVWTNKTAKHLERRWADKNHQPSSEFEIAIDEEGVGYQRPMNSHLQKIPAHTCHFYGDKHPMAFYCLNSAKAVLERISNELHTEFVESWHTRDVQSEEQLNQFADSLEEQSWRLKEAIQLNYPLPDETLMAYQQQYPELTTANGAERALLSRELKVAALQATEQTLQSLKNPTWVTTSPPPSVHHIETPPRLAGMTLSQAISGYMRERQRRNLSTKTLNKYNNSLSLVLCILGDRDLAEITAEEGRNLRECIQRLPVNTLTETLRSQNISQILTEGRNRAAINPITANDHLKRIVDLFRWAQNLGYITNNPIPSESIPMPPQNRRASRSPITQEEAKRVFQHELFTRHRGTHTRQIQHAHHFFVPLLCLMTGCRLGEVSQLYTSDVVRVGDVACIKIAATHEGQWLKTPNAQRTIPIHPELLRLGFMAFVERRQLNGDVRLFPNISLIQGGYSNKPSEWFIRHFRDGLNLPPHVTPHAFRHSFKDQLVALQLPDSIVNYLMGHSSTNSNYGAVHPENVSHLQDAVNRLSFSEILREVQPILADYRFHAELRG